MSAAIIVLLGLLNVAGAAFVIYLAWFYVPTPSLRDLIVTLTVDTTAFTAAMRRAGLAAADAADAYARFCRVCNGNADL